MTVSQFTCYTSADAGAPQLSGLSGSLLTVLDWCLVTGSKWLKPFANTASVGLINNLGCYKQPSGSGCTLFVNDAWPIAAQTGKEAIVTGWGTLLTMSVPLGTGSGQFPYYGQLLTNGHFVIRKSATADTTVARPWVMYADPWTFYFFHQPGDTAGYWSAFFFGDIYSFFGETDTKKCMIQGRGVEGSANPSTSEPTDLIHYAMSNSETWGSAIDGFIHSSCGGIYSSNQIAKVGDFGIPRGGNASVNYSPMNGITSTGNRTIHLAPIRISEFLSSQGNCIRGRMRGMYQMFHPSIGEGVFGGTNDTMGKTFTALKLGWNGGYWVIETSATLETN